MMPTPIAMPLPLPAPGPLVIQPLFPVALGQVQLRPDPLELAAQLQALLALRGGAASNPDPGCAWTGDLNGGVAAASPSPLCGAGGHGGPAG